MVIDEIQLAPGLLRPMKVVVDLDPTPRRFLLTGSSQILALRNLPDTLPGRMEIIELWPFSQGEISGAPDRSLQEADFASLTCCGYPDTPGPRNDTPGRDLVG